MECNGVHHYAGSNGFHQLNEMHEHDPPASAAAVAAPHAKPHGNACVLAIARAVPAHKIVQRNYTDFYFKVTNCDHKTELKQKMARICEKSGVETRYSIMTEEFLRAHPEMYTPGQPSLEERHRFLAEEVPRLAQEAGEAALREWGRPARDITHLVVVTLSGVAMPGADVHLVKSLGLRPSVRRVMLYMLGCYAGVTALRVAKDLAENNPGSRVLICCSEVSATTFRAPDETSPYNLVGAALFGDGAVGVVVGANPNLNPLPNPNFCNIYPHSSNSIPNMHALSNPTPSLNPNEHTLAPYPSSYRNSQKIIPKSNLIAYSPKVNDPAPKHAAAILAPSPEHPIYEIHTAIETIIPNTENIIQGTMKAEGLQFFLDRQLPSLVSTHVVGFCEELLKNIPEKPSLEEVFWAVHAGGPAILDAVEQAAKLSGDQLQASRRILANYGNVSASTVLFVLDELRNSKSSMTPPEWGIAIAFGPGITFEGILLRKVTHQ